MEQQNQNSRQVCCPYCASTQIAPVDRSYDGGLGCLGLILFGWWGLLLGLLGAGRTDLYCMNCGRRWNPHGKGCIGGCISLLFFLFLIGLLVMVFG